MFTLSKCDEKKTSGSMNDKKGNKLMEARGFVLAIIIRVCQCEGVFSFLAGLEDVCYEDGV